LIAIIDYGVGNLKSVEKAFHFIGCRAEVSSDRDFILCADAVILPGVGAFADAMESLRKTGMDDVVRKAVKGRRPFLGICLGMQLLFDYSEEGGEKLEGLGVFKGSIRRLPPDMNLKIPHMGWNSVKVKDSCPLFKGMGKSPYVYFVHSYYLTALDRDIVAAGTEYGTEFDAAIWRDNVFATQFHPEKSGEAGLLMLRNFASLI
jgi:glutamine amidotransferase